MEHFAAASSAGDERGATYAKDELSDGGAEDDASANMGDAASESDSE